MNSNKAYSIVSENLNNEFDIYLNVLDSTYNKILDILKSNGIKDFDLLESVSEQVYKNNEIVFKVGFEIANKLKDSDIK